MDPDYGFVSEWSPWFAWYPVRLMDGRWRWFSTVCWRDHFDGWDWRSDHEFEYADPLLAAIGRPEGARYTRF